MRVHIRRRVRFSAAHSYENIPDDVFQSGTGIGLTRRSVHGHNFTVDLSCSGQLDARTGMVVNITDVDRVLKGLLMPLHESFLERDHPAVAWGIPSTENLAVWIWRACEGRIPGAKLERVRVWEDDFLWSDYMGDSGNTVYVTRAYEFAAAHRLHSPALSDDENCRIFGKCNNPNGHGHNYGLEVTVRGQVDPRSGLACRIGEIDAVVNECVVNRFDHRHLNLDLPEFAELNPTSENIAVVIWNLLRPRLGDQLHRVCVGETERNYFEYFGEE